MKQRLAVLLIAAHTMTYATGASAQNFAISHLGGVLDETSRVLQVKTKKSPSPSYRRADPRPGDRLIGRVAPQRARNGADDAAARALLGALGMGLGAVGGGMAGGFQGGSGGTGCQVDYTTANLVGCGGNIASPRGNNGLRGPYKCQGRNGNWYTSRTFRAGCYMASMDRLGTRNSDILGRAVGGN